MRSPEEFDIFTCPLQGRVLVEASAGTGKTWNIGGLYLRLLLEKQLEVKQILVVTFTRAATAELRDRIRGRIEKALSYLNGVDDLAEDPFLLELIGRQLEGGVSHTELTSRLQLAFESFDQASIFTIHSFCQRALATTAFSAGVAFTVRTETDDGEMVLEAVQDFWRRHIANGHLSPAFSAWLEKKRVTPEKLMQLLRRHLRKPLAKVRWPEEIGSSRNQDENPGAETLVSAFHEARRCWDSCREEVLEIMVSSSAGLNQQRYKPSAIESAFGAFDRLFATGDPLGMVDSVGKTELLTTSKLLAATKKDRTTPEHLFFGLAETLIVECRQTEADLSMAWMRLLKRFLEETVALLKAKKQEKRVVAFDDMLIDLYKALHNPDLPWLPDVLRQQFPAALIDEFQDTDPLQYAIFRSIYADSDLPVFMVGDPKQAIYSFRNADLHTYFAARAEVDHHYTLPENHRSTAGLIDACNTVFSANSRAFMQSGLDFLPVRSGNRERPELLDLSEQPSSASLTIWRLPDENGEWIERSLAKERSVDVTADEIARLLNASAEGKLAIGGKPVCAGDMAVLVRSHREAAMVRGALSRRGIGSVSLSHESVFASREAQELESVLAALLSPGHESLLKAALSTEMLGLDAAAMETLSNDDARLSGWFDRFEQYRNSWISNGIGYALRFLMDQEGVVKRLLALPDGERRMTNLMHLAELLNRESENNDAPDALLRYLAQKRESDKTGEEEELRLETDRNLVQIMTVHRSKGLEFAFVFCPLLWDAYSRRLPNTLEGVEYHDNGSLVIDFTEMDRVTSEIIKNEQVIEMAAESLRLIYVALTRAVYRCYLVAGCYSRSNAKWKTAESQKSLLNWLVAGDGVSPDEWLGGDSRKKTDELATGRASIEQGWKTLETRCRDILLSDLPENRGLALAQTESGHDTLTAHIFDGFIASRWRMNSFSGLMRNAVELDESGDHDEYVASEPDGSTGMEAAHTELSVIAADDILLFPKGTFAGSCLHAMFENADFTNPQSWNAAIENALQQFPQPVEAVTGENGKNVVPDLKAMANRMMEDVLNTSLTGGIVLSSIPNGKRLTELPFCLSEAPVSAKSLNALFKRFSYPVPQLVFDDMNAFLNGFIDLVFERDGRFYVLDWKSNVLGIKKEDYGPASVAEAMAEHGYHWQYLLYTVALHRFLSLRLPDYDYDRHVGGALYLFIRGVRPDWRNDDGTPAGVFFDKPDRSVIEAIDSLLKPSEMKDGKELP